MSKVTLNFQEMYLESVKDRARLEAINADLLAALEGLDPTHQGDQQGAAYWLPIHLHPLHRKEDDCPWCQRDTTIQKAKNTQTGQGIRPASD